MLVPSRHVFVVSRLGSEMAAGSLNGCGLRTCSQGQCQCQGAPAESACCPRTVACTTNKQTKQISDNETSELEVLEGRVHEYFDRFRAENDEVLTAFPYLGDPYGLPPEALVGTPEFVKPLLEALDGCRRFDAHIDASGVVRVAVGGPPITPPGTRPAPFIIELNPFVVDIGGVEVPVYGWR